MSQNHQTEKKSDKDHLRHESKTLEQQRLESYDARLYNQQKKQVQILPIPVNQHPTDQQKLQLRSTPPVPQTAPPVPPTAPPLHHHTPVPPPNLFPHPTFPIQPPRYPYSSVTYRAPAPGQPQSAPIIYGQPSPQPFFYGGVPGRMPDQQIHPGPGQTYFPNRHPPNSFSYSSPDNVPKVEHRRQSTQQPFTPPDLSRQPSQQHFTPPDLSRQPSQQLYPPPDLSRRSSQTITDRDNPDLKDLKQHPVPFTQFINLTPYYPVQQPMPPFIPIQAPPINQISHLQQPPPPPPAPAPAPHTAQHTPQPIGFPSLYQLKREPLSSSQESVPSLPPGHFKRSVSQISLPSQKVVHESTKSPSFNMGVDFFPKRDSLSSEESIESTEVQASLDNQIYGQHYLKLLMANLAVRQQESSDTEFSQLCYLLELDCCATKSNGSEPFVCDPLDSLLLANFINYTAPWLDVYCRIPIFSKYLSQLALCEESMMMYNSLLSCGALYLHREKPESFDLKFALKYYTSALKLLSMKILQDDRVLPRCLICSILLSHYEDFAGELVNKFNHHSGSRIILQEILAVDSGHKKRRSSHASDSRQVDLSKLNSLEHNFFLEAAFWVITNNDLQESLKWEIPSRWSLQNSNTTVLAMNPVMDFDASISEYISTFFDVDFKKVDDFFKDKDELWWLRKSAYNLQLINDFSNQPYVISKQEYIDNLIVQKWIELKKMSDSFGKYLPLSLRNLVKGASKDDQKNTSESNFPQIKFKNHEAAIININYHLGCLLLYDSLKNRTGLFSQSEEEVLSAVKILKSSDKEVLTKKRNLKKLIKQHAISIIGILQSYHNHNIVWSLTLGHFKIALKVLKKYDQYHLELDPLLKEIQTYTKTRFNRI